MVIIEQVTRSKWDQERIDELALDRNGTYIHNTVADNFVDREQKVEGVLLSFSLCEGKTAH